MTDTEIKDYLQLVIKETKLVDKSRDSSIQCKSEIINA